MLSAHRAMYVVGALLVGFSLCGCQSVKPGGSASVRFGFTTTNFLPAVPVSVGSSRKHIDYAKQHGMAFMELRDPDGALSADGCREVAAYARQQGVEVLYSVQRGLLAEDMEDVFGRMLVNAPLFDGPGLARVLALRGDGELGWSEQEFTQVVAAAKWCAAKATAHGLVLMIENADVVLDGSPTGCYGMVQLLDALGPAVELQLDTGNLFAGPTATSPRAAKRFIRRYANRISYTHMKSARDGQTLPILAGNPLSFVTILSLLADRSTPLYVAVELNSGGAPEAEVLNNMQASLQRLSDAGLFEPACMGAQQP